MSAFERFRSLSCGGQRHLVMVDVGEDGRHEVYRLNEIIADGLTAARVGLEPLDELPAGFAKMYMQPLGEVRSAICKRDIFKSGFRDRVKSLLVSAQHREDTQPHANMQRFIEEFTKIVETSERVADLLAAEEIAGPAKASRPGL